MKVRKWWVAGIIALVVLGALAYRNFGWSRYQARATLLDVNLAEPDAVIRTSSFARLPRDLLKVPIAHDVLTDDFADYYEQNEDRLGLGGSLKRIAYENKLDLGDELIRSALNEPAEMGLWRDGKGALRHYAIVIKRNALAHALQEVATVALKDRQLTVAGEIRAGGSAVTVYALALSPRRTYLLAAHGERIVLLSDPGLLLGAENKVGETAANAVADWLTDDSALTKVFALGSAPTGTGPAHTLALGSRALALGYGAFVPGFKGLRFDFGGDKPDWATQVWIEPSKLPHAGLGDADLWRNAPANPAACTVLPVDWQLSAKIVEQAAAKLALPDAKALSALDGAGLVCWYARSTLYTPLLIARLSNGLPDRDRVLTALAQWAITPHSKSVVVATTKNRSGAADVWRSSVEEPAATLASSDNTIVFSPDAGLIELALDTVARKNPSVQDQFNGGGTTIAYLAPKALATMARKEMLSALEKPGEANTLAAARNLLPPRLDVLAKYPAYRLTLPQAAATGWQRVEWRSAEQAQ